MRRSGTWLGTIGAAVAVLAAAPDTLGQAWTETGDAAEFPAECAQIVSGSGSLVSISGSTDTGVDDFVDAYVVEITDPESFYATTSVLLDPAAAATWDTRLFLFDLAGNSVLANDDAPGVGGAQSYVSDPATYPGTVDPTAAPLVAGTHVLVVTGWANDPRDSGRQELFALSSDSDALHGPDPAAGLFDNWENSHGLVQSGVYTIALQGASFVDARATCPADVNCDLRVDVLDLLAVILAWGEPGGSADINDDGTVDVQDLLAVILAWGPC